MSSLQRSRTSRLVAAAMVVLSAVAGTGYFFVPHDTIVAQQLAPATKAPAEAIDHANTLSEAFRYSADHVLPAVVSIRNEARPRLAKRDARPRGGNRPQLPPELGELDPLLRRFFEQMPEGEGFDMQQMPRQSSGSGVIIDPSGVILTNNHVVAGGGKITVRLNDGREFEANAEDIKTDDRTDLAVVKIKANDSLPYAKLGDSDRLRIGDWVIAVGQPFGLENTVTAGIVSATGRAVGITKHEEFIQTDAAINPGNSGGPLVNLKGEVIGINTAISSSSGGFQGVGFAVPVNVAKWVSSQLLKDGTVHRAYLGVGIQPIDQNIAEQLRLPNTQGALVTEVRPNSPAEKAGLKPQDVIVQFNGSTIYEPRNLSAVASRAEIGTSHPIVVLRDGKRVELKVTVLEQPANYGEEQRRPSRGAEEEPERRQDYDKLGLQVGPLSSEVARELGISGNGVAITAVEEDSIAARAGLAPSMAIVQVGRQPVKSVADYRAALNSADLEKGVLLLVKSAEGSRFVVLRSE
jgi:serine protease Do